MAINSSHRPALDFVPLLRRVIFSVGSNRDISEPFPVAPRLTMNSTPQPQRLVKDHLMLMIGTWSHRNDLLVPLMIP